MEANDLIQQIITQLNGQIETREMVIKTLVGAMVFLCTVIGTFFIIYQKEKHKSDEMFKKMNTDFLEVIKQDIETKKELKHSIDSNIKVSESTNELIKKFPDIMKDTIMTAFKVAKR